ncbi:MAG: putative restriction enzyme [Haloplasmataceae bacterium]|jgi:hypothetical protein|nr:putative restriction enzyme [Haloplasmataceae bacterium]
MEIYSKFNELGQNNITTTSSDFTNSVGIEGMRDIIKKVLLGGNVRDITEFITQRRLMNTYASTIELFINTLSNKTNSIDEYSKIITDNLKSSRGNSRILDLWLLGLTKKGLDNIVRTVENIEDYEDSFSSTLKDTISDLEETFGTIEGTLSLNGNEVELNWNFLSLLCIALGSQTLSIRGSSKSMNGKLFEKLVLGSLLTIMNFTYCKTPPDEINKSERLFWLSNMDENEREIDATIVYNGIAISIDIGFIGRGNPEITLDKVTRFAAYKEIGGIEHNMSTIIIVDTVGDNSDLFNKANRVNGNVLQMRNDNWIIEFAKLICSKFNINHDLKDLSKPDLNDYLNSKLSSIDFNNFI